MLTSLSFQFQATEMVRKEVVSLRGMRYISANYKISNITYSLSLRLSIYDLFLTHDISAIISHTISVSISLSLSLSH